MKRLLAIALCAMAVQTASAASIQWNLSLGRSGFIADSTGAGMNGTLYLVFTSSADTLSAAAESDTFASTLSSVSLGEMTLTSGKNTATQTTTSDKLVADTEYSFSLVVFDTANSQYYLSSAISQKAYDESATIVSPTKVTFQATQVGSTFGANWSSSTPTSVPEPATAALALLGLGLMIKRRKA